MITDAQLADLAATIGDGYDLSAQTMHALIADLREWHAFGRALYPLVHEDWCGVGRCTCKMGPHNATLAALLGIENTDADYH